MYEKLYSKKYFRKNFCTNQEKGEKCEFMITCPYRHKEDEEDYPYDHPIFNHYNKRLLKNIEILENEINYLEKVKFSHMCSECDNFLQKEYYFCKPCNHILCSLCFKKNVILKFYYQNLNFKIILLL